jgi:hypothetical protein
MYKKEQFNLNIKKFNWTWKKENKVTNLQMQFQKQEEIFGDKKIQNSNINSTKFGDLS